jgi:8-oxo-dGTP pyrophosphatase MutT (NUDIX family)
MSLNDQFWADHESVRTAPPQAPLTRWKDNNKAGIIPYYKEPDGTYKFLMMVASDPRFGGFKPMISKGTIEDGESILECAIREAVEEVGLVVDNCTNEPFEIFNDYVSLRSVEYHMTIFAVEVASKQDFIETGRETKFTTWMSIEAFNDRGRKDHQPIVQKLYNTLVSK